MNYASLVQNTGLWEDTAAVGGTFRVDWKRRFDLPFLATNHLYNSMNEGKPVRIGRDGQELPADVGRALCQLFDKGADEAGIPPLQRPAGARCCNLQISRLLHGMRLTVDCFAE